MADNRRRDSRRNQEERDEFDERVVDIRRVAKVIKGGRRFAFRTVVVVGDGKGNVGIGIGKARAVPDSIRKAAERARRNIESVSLSGTTIPYTVTGRHGGRACCSSRLRPVPVSLPAAAYALSSKLSA